MRFGGFKTLYIYSGWHQPLLVLFLHKKSIGFAARSQTGWRWRMSKAPA